MCNINIVALCCSPFCIMCWVVHVSGGGGQGLRQEKQLRLLLQGLGYLMMSQDLVQTSSRMTLKKNNMCFPSWALVAFRFGHFLVGFLCPCFSVFFLFLCSLLLRCSEFLLFACLLIFFSLLFCLFAFLLLHCSASLLFSVFFASAGDMQYQGGGPCAVSGPIFIESLGEGQEEEIRNQAVHWVPFERFWELAQLVCFPRSCWGKFHRVAQCFACFGVSSATSPTEKRYVTKTGVTVMRGGGEYAFAARGCTSKSWKWRWRLLRPWFGPATACVQNEIIHEMFSMFSSNLRQFDAACLIDP